MSYRRIKDNPDDSDDFVTNSFLNESVKEIKTVALAGKELPPVAPTSPDAPCVKVIKVIGIPENGDGPGIPSPRGKEGEDSHSYKNRFVDVVDASNDDPFTLDSFENLIRLHAQKGKDFIMARVTTADPQDPNKFYHSYYAAHHINKVLFRTQPEEGLLHRMCARNVRTLVLALYDIFNKRSFNF
jgi:hypothetical protein